MIYMRVVTWIFWGIVVVAQWESSARGGDKPSKEYEAEMQPGGLRSPRRYQNRPIHILRRDSDWKVPRVNMRNYHDLAGLPANREAPVRVGNDKLHYSPESTKTSALSGLGHVAWEIWRLDMQREGISWTAEFASVAPLRKPFEAGFHQKWDWTIGSKREVPRGWDASFEGTEEIWVHTNPVLSGRGATKLIHWRVYRDGARYITPRLKLSDLKQYAPWFYDHIPSYVLEREDWFHFWETYSIAVYINHDATIPPPRMIEFVGLYSLDCQTQEKRFDTFFAPNDFHRMYVRGESNQNALNLARPSREADVLILDAPAEPYRLRFMVTPAPIAKATGLGAERINADAIGGVEKVKLTCSPPTRTRIRTPRPSP